MRRALVVIVAVVAASMLGVACGGSDNPTIDPGGSPATTMSPDMPGMDMPDD